MNASLSENELATTVLDIAFLIHSALGPGLLESAYKECLHYKFRQAGLKTEREKPLPLKFESVQMECGYRVDFLINDRLILEVKSVDSLNDVHLAQTLTYLRLSENKLGLLLNFNVTHLKQGIRRVVNKL